eukprot:NODE_608_length_6066_cov_0.184347.p1 type:complete len:749 gc:universal NODE_608_length_6066_cov_0.184347:3492-5738(+)
MFFLIASILVSGAFIHDLEKRDSAVTLNINALPQATLNSYKASAGNALFWEAMGVQAVSNARGSKPFQYNKYVSGTTPNTSLLMSDYSQVGGFLAVCIIGAALCFLGTAGMIIFCLIRQPKRLDPDDVTIKKKITAVLCLTFVTLLTVFLIFVCLGSLSDYTTGMSYANLAAGSVIQSGTTMLQSTKVNIGTVFQDFNVNTDEMLEDLREKVNIDIDSIYNEMHTDGVSVDMYLDNSKTSVLLGKEAAETIINAGLNTSVTIKNLRENFNNYLAAVEYLDGTMEDPDDNTIRFSVSRPNQYQYAAVRYPDIDTFDPELSGNLSVIRNSFDINVPTRMIGAAIDHKLDQLKIKTNITLNDTYWGILKAINSTQNDLTDLFNSVDSSALKSQYDTFNSNSIANTSTSDYYSIGIYIFFGVLAFLLLVTGVTISLKMTKVAMGSLCSILFLTIFCFVISFVFYVFAFLAGDSCMYLDKNTESLKFVNPDVASYTSAGLAAKSKCNKRYDVYQILQDPNVQSLLPSGFNQSVLNIQSLVEEKIDSEIKFAAFRDEINQDAYDFSEFVNFHSDVAGLNFTDSSEILGKLPGTAKYQIYLTVNKTVASLKNDASLGIEKISDESTLGVSDGELQYFRKLVAIHLDRFGSFKNFYDQFNSSRIAAYNGAINIPSYKDQAINNITSANVLLANVTDRYSELIDVAKTRLSGYYSEVKTNITQLIIQKIVDGLVNKNCAPMVKAVDAMTTSICQVAL